MVRGLKILMIIIFGANLLEFHSFAQISGRNSTLTYTRNYLLPFDESIFTISNYSEPSVRIANDYTVSSLLENGVDGFSFSIQSDKNKNLLVVKNPDSTYTPFLEVVTNIKKSLENDKDKLLTLFLDFNGINVNDIIKVFESSGAIQYVTEHNTGDDWPTLKNMVDNNQRLVVFAMNKDPLSPSWIMFAWDHVFYPPNPSLITEAPNGDITNTLFIFNDFNTPEILNTTGKLRDYSRTSPYFIELFKSSWLKTGKIPNFILLDFYGDWITNILALIQNFKSVKGVVTINSKLLNYLSWENLNNFTSGNFSFPIAPGDQLFLKPSSPGYKFSPESITIDQSNEVTNIHFEAIPLKITDNLEAYYPLNNDAKDYSRHKRNGVPLNIEFKKDSIQGMVASFSGKSKINLPQARLFNINDHDFTVSAWIKIPSYRSDKTDYCIVGAKTILYEQGLHIMIRNQKPYFGFYSNDLDGKSAIKEGQWNHLVFRYNKLNGEQSIFLNGRQDSYSFSRPSFKGVDSLYFGVAGFSDQSYLEGNLDDVTIWSRTLSDDEIWGLSKQVISILPKRTIFWRFPALTISIFTVTALIIIYFLVRFTKVKFFKKANVVKSKILVINRSHEETTQKNLIKLFGDFVVYDKDGKNITDKFTPKVKQLFLVLMVHSVENLNGISTKELSEILWKGYSNANIQNIRGVTMRKLRLALEPIEKIEIIYYSDRWLMKFTGQAKCDYIDCINLIKEEKTPNKYYFQKLINIVQEGEVFKGESYDWLDKFKGYLDNKIVDILNKSLELMSPENDSQIKIKLADLILNIDPVNDEALSFKIKALVSQNNYKSAKYTYEQFSILYKKMYGEVYSLSFDQIIS